MTVGQLVPFTAFPAVDTFSIAGLTLTGKWTLLSAPKKFGWQIQQGYGLSGAFVFPKGDELITPKFKGEFWDHRDWAVFKETRKRLLQKGVVSLGIIASAMGIDHPELKALGVTSVVTGMIGPATQSKTGLWTIEIEFLQYRPPLPAPPKPKQVIPTNTPALPTAKNNQEKELQALRKEAAGLVGKL